MGIQYLNQFIRENASKWMKVHSLSDFAGKKVAIDVSIYMYKFASTNVLIENMCLMLSIFKYWEITPVFIFDGKPPVEKKELLEKRKLDKVVAQTEYKRLEMLLDEKEPSEKEEVLQSMNQLKRQFVSLKKTDVENVKNLLRCYGATYYDAPGEADALCAWLVLNHKVWACLSEDMDMVVYGCPRVFRYFSLANHTLIFYDVENIVAHLGMTQQEMRQMCVLSGTDYNCHEKSVSLYSSYKYMKQYKASMRGDVDFYEWMAEMYPDVVAQREDLVKICKMFDVEGDHASAMYAKFANVKIANGNMLKSELMELLKQDGFIFPTKKTYRL